MFIEDGGVRCQDRGGVYIIYKRILRDTEALRVHSWRRSFDDWMVEVLGVEG